MKISARAPMLSRHPLSRSLKTAKDVGFEGALAPDVYVYDYGAISADTVMYLKT